MSAIVDACMDILAVVHPPASRRRLCVYVYVFVEVVSARASANVFTHIVPDKTTN